MGYSTSDICRMEMINGKQVQVISPNGIVRVDFERHFEKVLFSCTKGMVSKTRLEGDLRNSGRLDPLLATTHDEL